MNLARIDLATGRVVNIEVAEPEWVAARSNGENGYIFVPYSPPSVPVIGLRWSPTDGFESLPAPESAVTP